MYFSVCRSYLLRSIAHWVQILVLGSIPTCIIVGKNVFTWCSLKNKRDEVTFLDTLSRYIFSIPGANLELSPPIVVKGWQFKFAPGKHSPLCRLYIRKYIPNAYYMHVLLKLPCVISLSICAKMNFFKGGIFFCRL